MLVFLVEGKLEVAGLVGSDNSKVRGFLFLGAESPLDGDTLKVVLDLLVGFHGKGEVFRVLGFGELEDLE